MSAVMPATGHLSEDGPVTSPRGPAVHLAELVFSSLSDVLLPAAKPAVLDSAP